MKGQKNRLLTKYVLGPFQVSLKFYLIPFQYSYGHAKLFAAHNVLSRNRYNDNIYLIGDGGNRLYHVEDKCDEGASAELTEVWNAPKFDLDCDEVYNASLTFPGSRYAVYGDGRGKIYIIDIEDNWKNLIETEICGQSKPFSNVSSILSGDGKKLHILVLYIEEKSKIENLEKVDSPGESSNFVNMVEWLELDCTDLSSLANKESKFERQRRFAFFGEIEHLELTENALLYFGEDKSFQLLYDSAAIDIDESEPKVDEKAPEKPPTFFWLQGVEDMAVWVMLPPDIHKKEIKVSLKPSHMSIIIKNETIMEGKLWDIIDSDSMTWTIDTKKNKLEITMCKANVGRIWQRFLANKDLTDGEEVMNADMVEKIHQELSHLTTNDPNANSIKENSQVYNNQELEACDDNSTISRVYMFIQTSPKVVKKVNVGDRQVVFISAASKESLGQLCLRHDVDGLVWQPMIENDNLHLEHVDTFDALGYVQASKSQRRFTVSAPDRSYAAIIDRQRHVYIYRKPEPISEGCELRNRKSGQNVQKVAKQQVPTLDHDPEDFVVGAIATSKTLFVATCNNLYCLKIH